MNVLLGDSALVRRSEIQSLHQVQADLTNWKALMPSKALATFLSTPPTSSIPRTSFVARLPLDCLGNVFEFLSIGDLVRRAARVSQAWGRIIRRLGIWRQFDLAALVHRSDVLTTRPARARAEFWMHQLASGRFVGLRGIDLSTATVHHRELGRILLAAPDITSLDFSHCDGFDDACCVALADSFRARCAPTAVLSSIKVNFNVGFAGHTFACAIAPVTGLRCIEVSGCTQLRNDDFTRLWTTVPSLETFRARGTAVTHVAFSAVPSTLPRLRHLDLSMCQGVTDEVVAAIAAKCQNLESLFLDSCPNVTDTGFQVFIAAHRDSTSLEMLHVAGCRSLSDSSLRNLVASFAPTLRRLAVDRTRLSGVGLSDLLRGLPRLEWLSCVDCVFARKDLAFSASVRNECARESKRLTAASGQFLGLAQAPPRRTKTSV